MQAPGEMPVAGPPPLDAPADARGGWAHTGTGEELERRRALPNAVTQWVRVGSFLGVIKNIPQRQNLKLQKGEPNVNKANMLLCERLMRKAHTSKRAAPFLYTDGKAIGNREQTGTRCVTPTDDL